MRPSESEQSESERWEAAKAAFKARDLAEAETLCLDLPRTINTLSFLGRIQALTNRRDQAENTLLEALNQDGANMSVLYLLGNLYTDWGDYEKAAEMHRRVLAQEENIATRNALGLCYYRLGQFSEAAEVFTQCISIVKEMIAKNPHPDLLLSIATERLHLGMALQKMDRFADAAAQYEAALKIEPTLVDAWENLGHALLGLGNPAAADYFAKGAEAVHAGPGKNLLRAKAIFYSATGDLAEAEACLLAVLQEQPNNVAAHSLLGSVQQGMGHFEDAVKSHQRVIELSPNEPAPYCDLVQVKKITSEDNPLIERIKEMAEGPTATESDKVGLNFALGKAYNDLGAYEEAMKRFVWANHHHQEILGIKFDREKQLAEENRIVSRYSREYLSRHSEGGSDSELPIFIVGMPRSGTTLTERILSAHRDVAGAGELMFWKEHVADKGHQFDDSPNHVRQVADEYVSLLRSYGPDSLRVTDKAPGNCWNLGPISLAFPHSRIIYMRRNPVDVCLSVFMALFTYPPSYSFDLSDMVFFYRSYKRLMAHWRAVLPAERLLEVNYRELVENTEATTRKLVEFCGLEWDEACLKPEENQREIRTASLWQARQPVYKSSLDRWKRYEPWLGPLRELLEEE